MSRNAFSKNIEQRVEHFGPKIALCNFTNVLHTFDLTSVARLGYIGLLVFRHPLNKKFFPVHQPVGLKRADWNFFFHISPPIYFFYSPPAVYYIYLCILYFFMFIKNEIRKKKNPDLPTGRFFPCPEHRKRFFT